MMEQAVFFYDAGRRSYLDRAYPQPVRERLERLFDFYPQPVNETQLDALAPALRSVQAMFTSWWLPELTQEQIRRYFPSLQVVFYAAGSVKYFAEPYLRLGIRVVSGWAANGVPVAEYAAAQIVLAGKGFFQNPRRMQTDYEQARAYSDACTGNYHAKVGILGAGAVGRRVIRLLRAYELEIWVYDPYLSDADAQELQVQKHSLEEIFSECAVISNHVAQLPETRGMIAYALLHRMQPYATLLNTGRGSQIVEADLIRAMQEDKTRTAVLDVTDPEPPLPDSPLRTQENIFLTTHIAGSMGGEIGRIGEYIAQEAERYCAGEPLRYEITLEKLKNMA